MFVVIGFSKNCSKKEAILTNGATSHSEINSSAKSAVNFEEYVAQDEVFEAYVPLTAIENTDLLNFSEQVNNNKL